MTLACAQEGFAGRKQIGVNLTIVDCLSEGFSRVPYEFVNGTYKSDPKTAKPLSEKSPWAEDPQGQLSMLTCWPYGIVEGAPKEKDERREDYKWKVYPGMVLRTMFWADAARGGDPKKFKDEMCPAGYDSIKAFSLIELELTCKVLLLLLPPFL